MGKGAYRRRHQLSEMTAVRKTMLKTLGISAVAAAFAVIGYAAQVQAQATKKEEPKAAAKAAPKKPPACNTLKQEAACTAREDCSWVGEAKDKKGKVTKKAYCRAKPKAPEKKETPKKAEPKK